MAKSTASLNTGDLSSSGFRSERPKSGIATKRESEILEETRRVRSTIAALESEKRSLAREMTLLEDRALRGWGGMSGKQVFSVLLLGVVLTTAVIVVPPVFVARALGSLVRPAQAPGGLSSYISGAFNGFWIFESCFFVFPIAIMLPWALIFKKKKRKPYAKWVPNCPSVSVILPAFNEEKNIGQSIEGILGQRYRGNLEVIVVDDGSTDKTFQIAKSYADRHSNVKAIRYDKNRGKHHALNIGFAEAKGEISVFSDTDSILTPDAISRMVSHFKDPEVGMVCGLVVIEKEENLLQRLQQIEYIYGQTIMRFCQSSQRNVTVCPGSCAAVRTEIAKRTPVTDRTLAEDADFTFSVLKEGWKVCQEPESLGYSAAPRNLKALIAQRKRWSYGTLQTMSYHKWAVRKLNPWIIKSWLECFLSPLVLLYAASFPLLCLDMGYTFPLFLLTYGMMPFAILGVNIAIGLRLFNHGEKVKLALLVPVYVVYGFLLNILQMCMFLAFLSRRGIHITRGGRIIHAV